MTPYLYFVKHNRAKIVAEHPELNFGDVMKLSSKIWQGLSPAERYPYE